MSRDEKDYASKGAAYGIGIPALVLGGLAVLNSGNGGGSGILGGLFGGGNNRNLEIGYMLENERRVGRIEAGLAATAVAGEKDAQFTNARFGWMQRETAYEIDAKTCRFIPGKLFLSPGEMADPYEGGRNVLVSRHHNGEGRCGGGYSPCGGYNGQCGGCGC